jgi:hypothetical protein
MLFPSIKKLVVGLGYPLRYLSGGSGRSYSYTDLVILDASVPQPGGDRKELSKSVTTSLSKSPWPACRAALFTHEVLHQQLSKSSSTGPRQAWPGRGIEGPGFMALPTGAVPWQIFWAGSPNASPVSLLSRARATSERAQNTADVP